MEESSSQEPKDESLSNPVDLSALKSFSFGTEWSPASKPSGGGNSSRSGRSDSRGPRPDRRQGGRPASSRDRRPPVKRKFEDGNQGSGPDGNRNDSRPPRDGGQRGYGGRRGGGGRQMPQPPYESPVFNISFYPEDNSFATIIKAMRTNRLTYELFEVSKIFLDKTDRFIASVTRKPEGDEKAPKVFVSIPDGMPFASEEDAISHAVGNSIESFFDIEEVEVEAPSGNFQFVNRCSITKVLLGPPNYHMYEQALRAHHSGRLSHLSFEKVQSSVETVREEEVINEWLESMKKALIYKSKLVAEGEEPKAFKTIEEAKFYLKAEHRAKVVKTVNYARIEGKDLEKFKDSEAYKAMYGELLRQRRFPLDTANAIRGRMRREKFSIYKKGSKGVTYVCASKRNFRQPGQVMAAPLDRIIRFLDDHQKIKQKEMGTVYSEWLKTDAPTEEFDEKKMLRDLHWLIADGYVSHFSDDTLVAQPVMASTPSAAKKPESSPEKVKSISEQPAEATSSEATPVEPVQAKAESPAEASSEEASAEVQETEAVTTEAAPEADSKLAEEKAEVSEPTEATLAEPVEVPESEKTKDEEAKA
ncbi:hypothetical protein MLD52_11995 [Puniceicoccaceae bacterium K14]|nr:hypothetical protein [Puniceicoccaceae bacterium K14]